MGLHGDDYIAANHGPNGWALHLNLELLRQRIGRGVIMYGTGQQYTGEATGVAWKETSTAGIAEVSIKTCDEGGLYPRGDAITVYCTHPTAVDPNIRVDMVVPYLLSVTGRPETLHDFGDGKIGDIKMWGLHATGTPTTPPAGWQLADGTNSTLNLTARFPAGYESGDADFGSVGTGTVDTEAAKLHTHTMTVGVTNEDVQMQNIYDDWVKIDAASHLPPYMTVAFIQRIN